MTKFVTFYQPAIKSYIGFCKPNKLNKYTDVKDGMFLPVNYNIARIFF